MASELEWWLETAPTVNWKWATTFADNLPHSYVIRGKNLSEDVYDRLFNVIWVHGEPHMFYRRVNIELHCPDLTMMNGPKSRATPVTGFKFWPMSHERSVSKAINVAPLSQVYGDQSVAPRTRHPNAPLEWERELREVDRRPIQLTDAQRAEVWNAVVGNLPVTSILEAGSLNGQAHEAALVGKTTRYRAVEASQTLLNQLVYRMKAPHQVMNAQTTEYLNSELGGDRFDAVISLFGQASRFTEEEVNRLVGLADTVALLMFEPGDTRFSNGEVAGYPTLRVVR